MTIRVVVDGYSTRRAELAVLHASIWAADGRHSAEAATTQVRCDRFDVGNAEIRL
jgi:hypothetical protein